MSASAAISSIVVASNPSDSNRLSAASLDAAPPLQLLAFPQAQLLAHAVDLDRS
jgi:hypothetical protein